MRRVAEREWKHAKLQTLSTTLAETQLARDRKNE